MCCTVGVEERGPPAAAAGAVAAAAVRVICGTAVVAVRPRVGRGDGASEAGLIMIFTFFFPLAASLSTVVIVEYLDREGEADRSNTQWHQHRHATVVRCQTIRARSKTICRMTPTPRSRATVCGKLAVGPSEREMRTLDSVWARMVRGRREPYLRPEVRVWPMAITMSPTRSPDLKASVFGETVET